LSRDNKTAIELFLLGVLSWEGILRRQVCYASACRN
jgi:hypothetical protein